MISANTKLFSITKEECQNFLNVASVVDWSSIDILEDLPLRSVRFNLKNYVVHLGINTQFENNDVWDEHVYEFYHTPSDTLYIFTEYTDVGSFSSVGTKHIRHRINFNILSP